MTRSMISLLPVRRADTCAVASHMSEQSMQVRMHCRRSICSAILICRTDKISDDASAVQMLSDRDDTMPNCVHGLPQLFTADTELARPVPNLIVLAHRNTRTVLRRAQGLLSDIPALVAQPQRASLERVA